ncbi:hypothetical protein BZA77DRAFT_40623 [Pyronema omphalodes]|nr:hypothetical protein BZA77DRAFT_40623 [Pyronema omphalodes]
MRFYGICQGLWSFSFFGCGIFFLGSKDMGLSKLRNLVFGSNHLFFFVLFCFFFTAGTQNVFFFFYQISILILGHVQKLLIEEDS